MYFMGEQARQRRAQAWTEQTRADGQRRADRAQKDAPAYAALGRLSLPELVAAAAAFDQHRRSGEPIAGVPDALRPQPASEQERLAEVLAAPADPGARVMPFR